MEVFVRKDEDMKISWKYILILLLLFLGCSSPIANRDSAGEGIICFGDSITEGVGATPGNDFPSILGQKLKLPVNNAVCIGCTSRDALSRLDEAVLAENPRMVIIQFNANDFFQKIPLSETRQNLDEIVKAVQQQGAMAVLVEVKTGLIQDQYDQIFQEISWKRRAHYIPDIMRGIALNPKLKSDGFHPNDSGYQIIAERIEKKIRPLLE